MHIHMHVCINMYTYTYRNLYVCIYIYTHMEISPQEHYWCNLGANGMSEQDLENVTSCDTQNANEKRDFETQAFLNVSKSLGCC